MARVSQTSLFEPSSGSSLVEANNWILSVFFGEVAVILSVLAVAFIGLRMLTGRLSLRDGVRVVLGLFVLLGAPVIAKALTSSNTFVPVCAALPC